MLNIFIYFNAEKHGEMKFKKTFQRQIISLNLLLLKKQYLIYISLGTI